MGSGQWAMGNGQWAMGNGGGVPVSNGVWAMDFNLTLKRNLTLSNSLTLYGYIGL